MAAKAKYQLDVLLGASTSSSFQGTLNRAAEGIESIGNTAKTVAAGITAVFAAVNVTRAIESAVETYSEFEQEMATVAAIAQATRSEYERMEEASLAAGRSTIYTAAEAASALEYMALAGWDVETSIQAQIPILRLAAATQKDLGTTSDLVTDSMSALGLEVDELDSYLNRLIAGNNNANTTAEQLMESLVKTGGASRTLGADLDDTITALGILANNGVKGEEAGTALNSIFTRIATNSSALQELERIGVSIFDENGSFIGLEESLTAINEAMADFTAEQKSQSLGEIAGTHRYSQFAYLLEAVKETAAGTTSWEELESEIVNSGGALMDMYDVTTDTLLNAKAVLNSAKEDMQIRIVDVFSDDAKNFTLWLAEKLPEATDSIVEFAEAHKGEFADALETAGELIEGAWGAGVKAMTWLTEHKGSVTGALTAIGTSLAASKIVSTGKGLISVLSGLASMGPAGWAVTAGAVAVGSIVGIITALEEADKRAAALDLAEHFGGISLSLEEIDSLARQIIGEESIGGIENLLEAMAGSADALKGVKRTLDDLQKTDWKINVGFDMSMDDFEEYGSQIESYIGQVESYAMDKGYEVHLATSLLFGNGSEQDQETNLFYSQIQEQLQIAGDELHDYLYNTTNGALLDGIIDIQEEPIIQAALEKINNITRAITEAENEAKFDTLTLKYNGADLDSDTMLKLLEDLKNYSGQVQEGALQAYESAMTSNRARMKLDENYTQEDFEKDQNEAWLAYLKQAESAEMNSATYALDTLEKSYPELSGYIQQYDLIKQEVVDAWTDVDNADVMSMWENSPAMAWDSMVGEMYDRMRESLNGDKRGLQKYVESMTPIMEALEQEALKTQEAGGKLNPETQGTLAYWETVKNISFLNSESMSQALNDFMETNDQMAQFIEQNYSEKEWLTERTQNAGESQIDTEVQWQNIPQQAQKAYEEMQNALDEAYTQGFTVDTPLEVKLHTSYDGASKIPRRIMMPDISTLDIASNARGGIYDHPILTTFAEEGPEAALPLDGSGRAKALWVQAGEMLGMFQGKTRDQSLLESISMTGTVAPASTAGGIKVEFNPVITIQGNADKRVVQEAVSMGVNELKEMLTDIMRERERTAF